MDVRDALRKVDQILDEERAAPTVRYKYASDDRIIAALAVLGGPLRERGQHPRAVQEHPENFRFQSTNFDLLCALVDQTQERGKTSLFALAGSRIKNPSSFRHHTGPVLGAGTWKRCASELPLVAEFLVRRGDKQLFITALNEAAASPGLTLLLLQLEEMIALNFTVFTDEEYLLLANAISNISQTLSELAKRPKPSPTREANAVYHVLHEVPDLCSAVLEQCRKARYLYLKGSLPPGMNLEVNQDKSTVRTFLEKLGFAPLLIQSLDEAEKLYRGATSPFELKSSMGHLRSFLEQLHLQACGLVHNKYGGSLPRKWGETHQCLGDHNVLTVKEQQFAITFYTLMSDTSVHPLVAEREYARLMRNMSIEYGLLLLTKLDRLGLK